MFVSTKNKTGDYMNLAFFDTKSYDKPPFERFSKDKNINIKFFDSKLNYDTAPLACGFDGICVFVNDTIDKSVIERLREYKVRFIALRCSGYNNVDLKYTEGKIAVFNVPSYSPYAVAEHAMAMLLTSVRRTHKAYLRTKDFNFSLNGLVGFDLHGKTAGVIGTGKIGRAFIDICKGFSMNVIAYDKFPIENSDIDYVSLDELYKRSDIISFHCPLTQETYHMLDKNSIEKLKRTAIIINTSRGPLIESKALLKAIKERKIGGACLDVYEEESDIFFEDYSGHIVEDDTLARLITMPNVLVTSHQAYLTTEALNNIAKTTIENILSFEKTGKCENELHCLK